MTKFNVLLYDDNRKQATPYDVVPYFVREWNDTRHEAFGKSNIKTKSDFKAWVMNESQYEFWGRCQFEFLMAPWPYRTDTLEDELYKIDVHEQIMLNIDTLVDILIKELKLNYE